MKNGVEIVNSGRLDLACALNNLLVGIRFLYASSFMVLLLNLVEG